MNPRPERDTPRPERGSHRPERDTHWPERGEPALGPAAYLFTAGAVGTAAALVTTGALALLARAEGQGPLQPINATSHVLHGPAAGRQRRADLSHSALGYAINHGAAVFWALPFTWWLLQHRDRSAAEIAAGALLTAGIAGAVDYGVVPRRLTPGWEHALSGRSVAAGFGALALGLAAGGLLARRLR